MPINIQMPALSPTMEEGTLAKWLVKEGDTVESGDVMAEIETDKATMEVEAVDEGKIGQILISEGTEGVKVNTPIAILIGSNEAPHPTIKKIAENPYIEKAILPSKNKDKEILKTDSNLSFITVREALRNAMAEEMRDDNNVFIMGEEVA